jgi:hypothetical protein
MHVGVHRYVGGFTVERIRWMHGPAEGSGSPPVRCWSYCTVSGDGCRSVVGLKRLHQLVEFTAPFPREPNDDFLPPGWRRAVARRLRRHPHLTNRLRLKAERLRQLLRGEAKQVGCGSEIHVHLLLTGRRVVHKLFTAATKTRLAALPPRRISQPHPQTTRGPLVQ